nr:energy-coupling factor transporter ATPase [Paenibacillus turicensis]
MDLNSYSVVEVIDVSYRYTSDHADLIHNLNLCINEGEWVAIVGGSGSGKSTLAGLLTGYLPRVGGGVRHGSIKVHGHDPATAELKEISPVISVVVQDPYGGLVLGCVEEEVSFGPENLCYDVEQVREYTTKALEDTDLLALRQADVSLLSGGQRQRTLIASVLAMHTKVVVFDESSSHLDQASRTKLLQVLHQLVEQGHTIITLSGRMDEIASQASRLIVMEQGKIVMDGRTSMLLMEQRTKLTHLGLLLEQEGLKKLPSEHEHVSVPTLKLELVPEIVLEPQLVPESKHGLGPRINEPPLLELKDFSFQYNKRQPFIFKGVNVQLEQGQWVMLRGENGAGKTTLSKLLTGLLRAPKAQMFWQGKDMGKWNLYEFSQQIGYVFQQPEQQFVAHTLRDELLYSPRSLIGLSPRDETPDYLLQRLEEILTDIGLAEKQDISPFLLSGGEKRLLSVAGSMIVPRKLYILDEPTAGLDYIGVLRLIRLCRQAIATGAAIIMITHEPQLFSEEQLIEWRVADGKIS